MATAPETFFDRHVAPEFRRYMAAEDALTKAASEGIPEALEAARDDVMRAAWSAAVAAHQMGDYAFRAKPSWLPAQVTTEGGARAWVQQNHCQTRAGQPIDDLDLLHDVADAFKHSELDKPSKRVRMVTSASATITTSTGFGQLPWGEGKFGGVEQVIVTLKDGRERALSSILQNALDAWRRALGRPLAPMGE